MVSHEHKCIFIHIPKCAGTSFEDLLGHFDNHEGRAGQDHRSVRMIQNPYSYFDVISGVDNAKDFIRRIREMRRVHANPKNGLLVSEQQYTEYYKFSIVRNPWMRAHSWYKNVMRDPIHQKNYKIPADISFGQFVKQFAGKGFMRPQTYWLKQFDGKINFDFIGRFEDLEGAYSRVKTDLKLTSKGALPHKIEGQKSGSSIDFKQETIDFIAEYYAEEIALFNYSFEI